METSTIDFEVEGAPFALHAATESPGARRPAVLVCHAWRGQTDDERGWAARLAALGYVGIAHDVYGKGVVGTTVAENQALMGPLVGDRERLGRRLLAGLEAARAHPWVDPARVAAIGFCFGGLCVLDLARRRAPLAGVVSFHGIFRPIEGVSGPIDAKVLVLTGYDDPMAKPAQMVALADELTAAGADFQVHAYGGTMHAFTNPAANDPAMGTVYSARAHRRATRAMEDFLAELFPPA